MTSTRPPNDATLALRVRPNDPAEPFALAAIYDRYCARLLTLCQSMLPRPGQAEDCLRDVFVIAATRLAELTEPQLLRCWLFSVARSECLDRLEGAKRDAGVDDLLNENDAGNSDAGRSPADADRPGADPTSADRPSGDPAGGERLSGDYGRPAPDGSDALGDRAPDGSDALGDRALGDRDRIVLELADRARLRGVELALSLGVPATAIPVLVNQARASARSSIAAVLVARHGRQVCPDLANQLDGWDGRLSTDHRKHLNRHIDACLICSATRDEVATSTAMLDEDRTFPPASAALRASVVAAATAAGAATSGLLLTDTEAGRWADGWDGGWPPASFEVLAAVGRARRWGAPLAVLVLLLLAIGGVFGLLAIQTHPIHTGSTLLAPATTAGSAPVSGSPSAGSTPSGNNVGALPLATIPVASAPPVAAPAATTPAHPSPTGASIPATGATVELTVIPAPGSPVQVTAGQTSLVCASKTCSFQVAQSTSITITALTTGPNARNVFSAPPSCAAATGNTCTFTITSNETIRLSAGHR